MSEEEPEEVLMSHDEAEAALDWGFRAAALMVLMHEYEGFTPEVREEMRVGVGLTDDGSPFAEYIEILFHNMPSPLAEVAIGMAENMIESGVEEHERMEAFIEEATQDIDDSLRRLVDGEE